MIPKNFAIYWNIRQLPFRAFINPPPPPPKARTLMGYFADTWYLTMKLFPAKSLWVGNSAKSMTSEGNSALLPANVDERPPLLLPLHVFLFELYYKSLNDWSLGKKFILFPSKFNVSLGCASGKHWDCRETKWTVSLGTSQLSVYSYAFQANQPLFPASVSSSGFTFSQTISL